MNLFLQKIIRDKILLRKILFTLLIVAASRSMLFIPLPGINVAALHKFAAASTGINGGGIRKYTEMISLSTGALSTTTVAALGLYPFLLSCIMVQIGGALVKTIGLEDRKRIKRCTYLLTIAMSLLQGYYIGTFLENPVSFGGIDIVLFRGWGFKLMVMVSLTAGVLFMLWLARLINIHGIGNGVAVLYVAVAIGRIPFFVRQISELYSNCVIGRLQLFCLWLLLVIMVCVIVITSRSVRKLPVRYAGSEHRDWITLRLSWLGRVPIGLSVLVLYLPLILMPLLPFMSKLAPYITQGGAPYTIIFIVLTVLFSYFYTVLLFRPNRIVRQMERYGCSLEGTASSREMHYQLDSRMDRLVPFTALFLIALGLLPAFISKVFGIPYVLANYVSGAHFLVVIGVFYDLECQIKSRLEMQSISPGEDWLVVQTASSEIESEIKAGFLRSKGVPCVVEPLRFTWGLPIKTAVDEYRLYVARRSLEKQFELLRS